jgi:hypothetical protein
MNRKRLQIFHHAYDGRMVLPPGWKPWLYGRQGCPPLPRIHAHHVYLIKYPEARQAPSFSRENVTVSVADFILENAVLNCMTT